MVSGLFANGLIYSVIDKLNAL